MLEDTSMAVMCGIDGYILSCSVCRDFNPVGELGVFAICRLFFIKRELGLGQGIQYLYFGYTGEKIVFTDSLLSITSTLESKCLNCTATGVGLPLVGLR